MRPRRVPPLRSLKEQLSRAPSQRPRGLDGPASASLDDRRRAPAPPRDKTLPLIILLASSLVLVSLIAWRWGVWEPAKAQATHRAPVARSHRAVEAALDAAHTYLRQNERGKAETVLREAVAEHPDDQELRIALGEALMAQRRFREAYEQYEAALAIGPREAQIEFTAGTLAYEAGMPERAVEHYSMAQTANPAEPRYPLYLGQVQARLGQTESAKASLLRAARLDDSNALAWGTLADIALRENNVGIALQHITRARNLQPGEVKWRLIEARALRRRGEPAAALGTLLALEPAQRRDAPVARAIAECYGMLGRHTEAAATLGEASDYAPTNGDLAFDAAVAAERAGDTARAVALAKRAAAQRHEGAIKMLARLGK